MSQTKLVATKANLIKAKDKLKLMEEGFDVLDKKRKVLIQLYNEKIGERNKLAEEVANKISEVQKKLDLASLSIGKDSIREIAASVPVDDSISLRTSEIMQTKIYKIDFEEKRLDLSYSFYQTNSLFDKALLSLNDIKKSIFKLAELDSTINNLDREIKKTSKKVNSLEKMQVPKYKGVIKDISSQIEEREREEFSKIKIVKRNKLKKEEMS
ncbi:MAG: V-type ATP synthase subunit D [Finegoldia sp.]|nr:V-type ATP synthase subunit D [Finegoldia sp.]